MKNLFTKLIVCLLVCVCTVSIASCKSNGEFKYPDYNELTTNPNEAFVTMGDVKVSNKDLYYFLLKNYGVEVLGQIIDEKLLPALNSEEENDFKDYLNQAIYGTANPDELSEDEKKEAKDAFLVSCHAIGLNTQDEQNSNHYVNYYRLEYKRYINALKAKMEEIKKADSELEEDATPHFIESSYVDQLNLGYGRDVKALYVVFNTYEEALHFMKKEGIDTTNLNKDWDVEPQTFFTKVNAIEANLDELYEVSYAGNASDAIAKQALTMAAGEYTHGPLAFSNGWFLLYVKEVESDFDVNGVKYADNEENFEHDNNGKITEVLNEELKEILFHDLCAKELLSDAKYDQQINKYVYELRQNNGLKIYYEGLEISYKAAYENIYSALSITNYDSFAETTDENTSYIATWNDGSLTADEMYDALISRYGALTTFLLIRQSVLLDEKYNTVANYATHEILDQAAYDELKKEEIDALKEAFEAGNFASSGYPAGYGWENFLRDYVGQLKEENIIYSLNSSLSEQCLALYKKSLYNINDASEVTVAVKENAVTLSSSKWTQSYDVELANLKAGSSASDITVSIVKTAEEAKKDEAFNKEDAKKNDWYFHLAVEYPTDSGKAYVVTKLAIDQAVMEEYKNQAEKAFSAILSGVQVFIDANNDGIADEIGATEKELLNNLIADLNEEARIICGTPDTKNLNVLSRNTNYYTYLQRAFTKVLSKEAYLGKNIRIKTVAAQTYNQNTEISEELSVGIKTLTNKVFDYAAAAKYQENVLGSQIDFLYRYEYEGTPYYVTVFDFENTFNADNSVYYLYVSKLDAKTASGYEEGKQSLLPSYYYYEQNKSSTPEVTVPCTAQLAAYYNAAINYLASDSKTNKAIVNDCLESLKTSVIVNQKIADEVKYLFEEALKNYK